MKLETLTERIEKAEARIAKKQNTIEKKTRLIEKKQISLDKLDEQEKRWAEFDIDILKDDIVRLGKEIEETRKQIETYKGQLAGVEAKERVLTELPELFDGLREELVTRWDAYDKEHRDYLQQKYRELGYTAFIKKFRWTAYNEKDYTDEKIHSDNIGAAKDVILDLIYRVKNRVGEITDWSGLRATAGNGGFTVLNGFVAGTQGRCEVESIGAGGYNIQRYHIRVLVKEIN